MEWRRHNNDLGNEARGLNYIDELHVVLMRFFMYCIKQGG